jgi:two-component system chemotaxis sensor kinase CheA
MQGAETELDRTIIEAIKDPMTHLVRNSVDHGIESPQDRIAAGKPAEGRLYLRAYHEGGQVNIEISDDGGGINPEKIRAKALQKGIITAEQAGRMSEREMVNLIFLPGFTTAAMVTKLSGRGVGMDVVKTNIEKIGGNVDVQSRLGVGTSLKVKIPLTLAIIPALMVLMDKQRYAIPQVSLLELVRLDGELGRKGVEMIHGAPVYRLRGRLLPLVYLSRELKLPARQLVEDGNINIVVLQADGRQFGLVVDGISDSKDIVVKPLGKHLKGLPVFSGATIMGDGRVALILDVIGISQSANVVADGRERGMAEAAAPSQDLHSERQALLLCQCGHDRIAVPLAVVARLEQFVSADIERSGGREVVQYRGEIMPLVRLASDESAGGEENETESLQVVVYRDRGRSVGLVVDQIMDIVEELVTVKSDYQRGNFMGTAVVQGRVTDILDVRAAIESVDPNYLAHAEAA